MRRGGGRDLAILLAGAAVEQALPLLGVAAEEDARVGHEEGRPRERERVRARSHVVDGLDPAVGAGHAGDRVALVGLKARPELNGLLGTVLGPAPNNPAERWAVRTCPPPGLGAAETLSLKGANLLYLMPNH